MSFGKTFYTRKEAKEYLKKKFGFTTFTQENGHPGGYGVRRLSKKLYPRRKKRYHVGTYMDFLNFC